MTVKAIVLIVLCLSIGAVSATPQGRDNVVGQLYTLPSKVLSEDRTIQVYLPQSYQGSNKRFPVLYILDGQRLFLQGVSLLQSFSSQFQLSPEFIVVGINNRYPQRFKHFGGTRFLDFVASELIPFIDKSFRTGEERLLFGWEFGGGFVIETLIDNPSLFSGYIAASPYPLDEGNELTASRLVRLEQKLGKPLSAFLYVAVSDNEHSVTAGAEHLQRMLSDKPVSGLNWHYRLLEGEEHRSTAYVALYHGLRKYFEFYPALSFNSLAEFERLGGIPYVMRHTARRAEMFGFSPELDPWTMYTVVRAAMRADDIEKFERFMAFLAPHGFAEKVPLARVYGIGYFYLKHKRYDGAIALYQKVAKRFPESAQLRQALGKAYYLSGQPDRAVEQLQLALSLASAADDPDVAIYEDDLSQAQARTLTVEP